MNDEESTKPDGRFFRPLSRCDDNCDPFIGHGEPPPNPESLWKLEYPMTPYICHQVCDFQFRAFHSHSNTTLFSRAFWVRNG